MQTLAYAGRSRLANIEAFNAVITGCGSGAWHVSLGMLQRATALSLRHSLVTAGAAIKATGSQSAQRAAATWHNAVRLLSCMRQQGMSPNIRHQNTVLSCEIPWLAAMQIFNSALDSEGSDMEHMKPTEFTGSLLMKKLETNSNWPMAIHIFLLMQRLRLQHDAVSGNAALRAAGNRRVGRDFAQHLITAEIPVDSATCSSAGNALDSEQVWNLLQQVRASSQEPDIGAYTSFLAALDNDGRWEVALNFLLSMAADGIQARV